MKKIMFFIGCFFLVLNSTWAITLSCLEVASLGEVIQCQVEEDEYIGIKAKYYFDDGLSYQGMQVNSNWKSYYNGLEGFSVGNVVSRDKLSFTLGVQVGIDVLVNQDYSIKLMNIEGNTLDYQYIKLGDVESKVRVVSDDNTLEKLTVSEGKLIPNFDKNVTQYQVEVSSDHIFIEGIATDSNAKVEGDIGQHNLYYGGNRFVVRVISVRGNVRDYVIEVIRTIPSNNQGTDTSSGNSSELNGEAITKSNDVTLKSLSISNGKIDFKSDTFFYSVMVDYDVDKIDVEAIPNSEKAKIEIEKLDKLEVGENTILVKVIAEDGSIGNYVIVVTRNDKKSNDASIRDIVIKGYDLKFKSSIYQYDLEIDQEDKLDIKVELNDQKATYKIIGNKNLKNNSKIDIVVKAEDGTERKYQVHIIKLNESNSSSIVDKISIISLISFVLFMLVLLVIKRMRRKTEGKDKTDLDV